MVSYEPVHHAREEWMHVVQGAMTATALRECIDDPVVRVHRCKFDGSDNCSVAWRTVRPKV
jgi:hypothetical protein